MTNEELLKDYISYHYLKGNIDNKQRIKMEFAAADYLQKFKIKNEMEAKNLRIGNLVRSKVNGIAKVCQVGISTNTNYIGGRCLNGNYWEDFHLPIEINAEWLENLAFKELDFVEVADRIPNLIKHRFDTPFGEVEITPRIGGEEFTFWWNEGNITTVRYVHELQNLFFAITGQELELKDES